MSQVYGLLWHHSANLNQSANLNLDLNYFSSSKLQSSQKQDCYELFWLTVQPVKPFTRMQYLLKAAQISALENEF